MTINPSPDYIFAKPQEEQVSNSGIIIQQTRNQDILEVIRVGSNVTTLKEGQKFICDGKTPVQLDGKTYYLVYDTSVLGVVDG